MSDISLYTGSDEWYSDVPRKVTRHFLFGLILLVVTFGGFGTWAVTAPLAAAVIAQGSFVATGRNKIVQHFEGGIIRDILVAEGDTVETDQPLIVLDETAALATERELFLRQIRLEAMEARLLAEYEEMDKLVFPSTIDSLRSDFDVASMLDAQQITFDASRRQLQSDVTMLERGIDALTVRASGYEFELEAKRIQRDILNDDLGRKQQLFDRGLIVQTELNTIRRAVAEAEGQIGRLTAEIQEVAEVSERTRAQIAQAKDEYRSIAINDLQAVQAELESVREQARRAGNILERTVIRAPVSGTVVSLNYHTTGGVVDSGSPILEILPVGQPLIIEASIPRNQIDNVRQGQEATVRLSGLNARTTPVLIGTVYYVSADAILDRSQEVPQDIYLARISVPPIELDRVRGFTPTPGMPAEIMIQTEARTFVQYLMKPVSDSMGRAFREQ